MSTSSESALARVAKASAETVAAAVRTVFAQPDAAHVRSQLGEVTHMLEVQFPDVATMLGHHARRGAVKGGRSPAPAHP